MITAFASVETAISAMKSGAFDYITKPFKNDEVLVVLRNAVERRRLMAENTALRQNLQAQAARFSGIIGRSSTDEAGVQPDHPGGAEPVDDPRSPARAAPARSWWRGPSTRTPRAPSAPSSRSIPGTCRRICSSPPSSATSRAPSPARSTRRRACATWPTRAPSSSTRSATSRRRRRPSCCV